MTALLDGIGYAGWALHALFPLAKGDVASTIFPSLDLGQNPGLIA